METITKNKSIEGVLLSIGDLIVDDVKENLIAQGHRGEGKLLASIVSRVKIFSDVFALQIFFNKYGVYVDKGVRASRIPFSNPTGRGGKSQYIEALTRFARRKMGIQNLKEARGAAFAIAKKHKKEGSPTKASNRFSRTGKRKGWFTDVVTENEKTIKDLVTKEIFTLIDNEIINVIIKSI